MTVAVISHPSCSLHDNGFPHHPESPERLDAINNQLIASGVDWLIRHYDAAPARREHLLRVHGAGHVERVFGASPEGDGVATLDGDTAMTRHSLEAALHAAGAAVMGVDLVFGGAHSQAFCAVRPPGHHAGRDNAAGFCLFNNVAVGAAHAMAEHDMNRIAIVDFDVHHGDGTENIFGGDERVLLCSSFQHPFYPFNGADTDLPNVLNLPLPAGTGSREWRAAVSERWLPALRDFAPGLVMISAGFDSHLEDDMGDFNLVEADYAWITTELCRIASECCGQRMVSCLEGGYDLSSLGRSAAAHIKAMAEYH